MTRTLTAQFQEDGFVTLRQLLNQDEVERYTQRLTSLAGAKARWTQADGVNRNPEFWPIIFNERLLAAMREIFGDDVRYLPHNDLHVGFSSFSWHRDSVNRAAGRGPDWNETRERYQLARVGIYLQRFEDSGFMFGLVTGSHRSSELSNSRLRRVNRRTGAVASVISGLSHVDLVGNDAEWLGTDAGDCILFDPRVLHTGSRFHGDKFSVFIAYGVENVHFRNHWHYYLNLRSDLGYSPIDPLLAEQLRRANLLGEAPPADMTIESAWIPSPTYVYVARHFK